MKIRPLKTSSHGIIQTFQTERLSFSVFVQVGSETFIGQKSQIKISDFIYVINFKKGN